MRFIPLKDNLTYKLQWFFVAYSGFQAVSSSIYAIFDIRHAQFQVLDRSDCCDLQKIYFNVFPKTKAISFTYDRRWFTGQSLGANFFSDPKRSGTVLQTVPIENFKQSSLKVVAYERWSREVPSIVIWLENWAQKIVLKLAVSTLQGKPYLAKLQTSKV